MLLRAWEYYDRVAEKYDSMYDNPRWHLYHELLQCFLKEHLKEPCKILDLGGGTGRWSLFFQNRRFDVVMVDPSEKMLKVAKEKGVKNVIKARAESLPFPSESFDGVLALGDVLSYVENRDKAFSEVRRVLKPKGVLVAMVDNFYTFLQQIVETNGWNWIHRFVSTQTIEIGDVAFSFRSYAFKPEDFEALEGFDMVDIRGIGVFNYTETQIEKNRDIIIELEKKFSKDEHILWKAEHIFFVLRKKEEPLGPSTGGCGRD
ncbi:class I SAM-dependent methyltransferase [Thermotoga sp. KOL6]|uniref:class I SAM-dependent methyltransferase n=1 Tax=Thermotoga sp. KOL6 TaxID=126741 RepID=UPI000C78661B|nr:class I SAM-dependent methyltransferase [Thermotoga sp. KOL6]